MSVGPWVLGRLTGSDITGRRFKIAGNGRIRAGRTYPARSRFGRKTETSSAPETAFTHQGAYRKAPECDGKARTLCRVKHRNASYNSAEFCLKTTHRTEEQTSELQSLMRTSYAVFCLKKKHQHKKQ